LAYGDLLILQSAAQVNIKKNPQAFKLGGL